MRSSSCMRMKCLPAARTPGCRRGAGSIRVGAEHGIWRVSVGSCVADSAPVAGARRRRDARDLGVGRGHGGALRSFRSAARQPRELLLGFCRIASWWGCIDLYGRVYRGCGGLVAARRHSRVRIRPRRERRRSPRRGRHRSAALRRDAVATASRAGAASPGRPAWQARRPRS